ncbi:T9SS type A sorting domain-containing protein [Mariniflexile aquimaris]|uniref:T9SS type A sorting domain-containing protein n=1 Tax=Mariniflexile aquimaris TaxID=881009 RepID=A0ABW3BVD4_9FLAO
MKNILFVCFILMTTYPIVSQNYYMTQPEGYGVATTGGGSVTPVTVTTYADLKAKIKLTTPQVILVSGTITFSASELQISEVVTNKTIIGLPGAKLVNLNQTAAGSGILNLKAGSSNVIIRNLIFEGPGAWDIDGRDNLGVEGCVNLWVDHCEFQDGLDGNFDIKNNSDNITVSWCKFTYLKPPTTTGYVSGGTPDHRFSNLIGSSSTNFPNTDGRFSVTYQNCYWADGVKARMPRARNSELHILNCYYKAIIPGSDPETTITSSAALGLGAGPNGTTCFVDNSHFDKVANIYSPVNEGTGSISLAFDNCLGAIPSNVGTIIPPTYNYTKLDVNDVATYIPDNNCGAGATLQVTSSGEMSSCGGNLSLAEKAIKIGVTYYPTIVDDILHIDFSNQLNGIVTIKIYAIGGQNVFNYSNDITSSKKLELDLTSLAKGLYLCNLQIKDHAINWKIIKK